MNAVARQAGDATAIRPFHVNFPAAELADTLRCTNAKKLPVSELATIAHELNQPLAAVIAAGHACRRWLSVDPANVERALMSADMIVRDGNAAAEVISRIRALFRRAPVEKSLLDMNEVIEELCGLIGDDLRSKGITLSLDLDPAPTRVDADRVQLQQVLTNIVRNGIEAMDLVTDRPKLLSISCHRKRGEIVIEIADRGLGIDERESVFESFYTTKPSGMGIGLAICRSIIEAHEGRLWASNNPICGATFGFALKTAVQD